jgi:hypothetical protein
LTSLPGFGRRCLLATLCAPLASSLDFLQGTLEKIHFQRFVRQRPFQLAILLAEHEFTSIFPLLAIATIDPFQLIAPPIQQSPMHT